MADPHDPKPPADGDPIDPQQPGDPIDGSQADVPVEDDDESAEPRRAASARFVVDGGVGADAAIREAMDPANQSLADALRLSFRVLQVVILVLVVMFIFSGWKQVGTNQSGVLTVWGKIAEVKGSKALTPGLKFSKWPYPAGEFVLFKESHRDVDLGPRFWPSLRGKRSLDEAIESATGEDRLKPTADGSLLTSGGDLVHATLSATYGIEDPERFVTRVDDSLADQVVRLVLERSVVHAAAAMEMEDVIDKNSGMASDVERSAQRALDAIDAGIRLESVTMPRTSAPMAIRRTLDQVQDASIMAEEQAERAAEQFTRMLTSVAGARYQPLLELIDEYEQALEAGDTVAEEEILAAINERLEHPETSGEVSRIIAYAKSYRSQVETTLGNDARYHQSLLPLFRRSPQRLINQLWAESYARVFTREDVETYLIPTGMGGVHLNISGLDEVQRIRVNRDLNRREMETYTGFMSPWGGSRFTRSDDVDISGKAGRQLNIEGDSVTSKGRK